MTELWEEFSTLPDSAQISADAFAAVGARTTLVDALLRAAARAPDRVAVLSDGVALTYAQTVWASRHLAAGLLHREGSVIGLSGRPVAIVVDNGPAFFVAYFGAVLAGGIPVIINPALPHKALADMLRPLSAVAVVASRPVVDDGAAEVVVTDAGVAGWADPGACIDLPDCIADTSVHLHSGGTTGIAKRIPYSHGRLLKTAELMDWAWTSEEGDTWLSIAPFSHVWGFLMGMVVPVTKCATVVAPKRFSPDGALDLIEEHDVQVFGGGPPAIYQGLLAAEGFSRGRVASLRVCPGGGAPFSAELRNRWREATGREITEGFGMTEVAPIAVNKVGHGVKDGSCGCAVPGVSIEVVDPEAGHTRLPPGTPGEIRVSAPHQMTGYVDNPNETAEVIRDGWIYTGDIGVLDAKGFLTLTDRKKDMLIVNGFNVFPREIEEVLLSHPKVAEAAVVGAPDDRTGERAVAFVSLTDAVADAELSEYCAASLPKYKLPAEFWVLDALPMTPSRKLDRVALRHRLNGAPN
jgi:long-chain acyl-CoA synthetase